MQLNRYKNLLFFTIFLILLQIIGSVAMVKMYEKINIKNSEKNFKELSNEIESELLYKENISDKIVDRVKQSIKDSDYMLNISIISENDSFLMEKEGNFIDDYLKKGYIKAVETSSADYNIQFTYRTILEKELNLILKINTIIISIWIFIIIIALFYITIKNSKSECKENKNIYSENNDDKNSVIELNFNPIKKIDDDIGKNILSAYEKNENSVVIIFDISEITEEQLRNINPIITEAAENIYYLGGAVNLDSKNLLLCIPKITLADGYQIAKKLIDKIDYTDPEIKIFCGITSRNERTISTKALLNEAEKSSIKAKLESSKILCFDADVKKYEEYVITNNQS